MVARNEVHRGDSGDQYQHHQHQYYQHHQHGQPPRPQHEREVIAANTNYGSSDSDRKYRSNDIHEHIGPNPTTPDQTNSRDDDEMHLQQHAYAGSGCARPDLQGGGELSRLASHIGKMLEPKPIVVYYKKKRPGDQQQQQQQQQRRQDGENEVPAVPLGQEGETAHAVPRGQRRVRNPPPRMTHLGPSSRDAPSRQHQHDQQQQGINENGEERGTDQHAEGFSCYYSRRPGEYLPDNRSDWRPVELRDDEATHLPWEQRKHHQSSAGTDTPLHANTSVKTNSRARQRDGNGDGPSNTSGDNNDDLPPMVLQTMFQYDDEEFIAAANTIMEHIQWKEVAHMDRKIGKMMAGATGTGANEGGSDDGQGNTSNSTLSSSDSAPSLIDNLGKGFVEAFLSALEYRMEGANHGEGENEMDGIVMEIQRMVDQHAAYFVAKDDIKVQMEAVPNGDKGNTVDGSAEISQDPQKKRSGFLPHADQSIAGYVPLEHNTPRSKNTSANKADEISIAKSFASTVKSAYEKIGDTLKSISREGSEANLQDKDKKGQVVACEGAEQETKSTGTVAYGRYIAPSGSALVDQSQRRQELVIEMQRLHAFMEKAGPMHNEVQRSCQYKIEELRTELEAMTLAAVNDGEISEVSSRSFDEKEGAVSPITARQQEERERDQKRDELIEKIEKLEQQLAAASNRVVRTSCERRIEQLQRDLTELDGLDSPLKLHDSAKNAAADAMVELHEEPNASRDTRDYSLQRQAVVDEMKRVEHVLNTTRIEDVKNSCRVRLEELRLELTNLTPEEGKEAAPFVDIAPLASFDRTSVIHGGSAPASTKKSTSHLTDRGRGRRLVKVMAPTDLPGGCKFSARLGNGEEFLASVPAGGVRKGEIFVSPVGNIDDLELGNSACGCILPWMDYLYDKL